MKVLTASLAALALAVAAVSGTSNPVSAQPPDQPGAAPASGAPGAAQPRSGRSCFWARNIRDFRSVDNRTAYVRVSGNDIYALEFFAPCRNVNWAHRVSLRSRTGSSICEGRGNAVSVFVRSGGSWRERCTVNNVRKLTADEIAALPRGARP
jgi:hypothetical protein